MSVVASLVLLVYAGRLFNKATLQSVTLTVLMTSQLPCVDLVSTHYVRQYLFFSIF